jgi:predicted ArsR family transcriptional regulator
MPRGSTQLEQGEETRKRILAFITGFATTEGYPPTIRQISDEVGVAVGAVHRHLTRLVAEQKLVRRRVSENKIAFDLPGRIS